MAQNTATLTPSCVRRLLLVLVLPTLARTARDADAGANTGAGTWDVDGSTCEEDAGDTARAQGRAGAVAGAAAGAAARTTGGVRMGDAAATDAGAGVAFTAAAPAS